MKKKEFQCAMCKNIYKKGWSDEEAKQEAEDIFGKSPDKWNDKPEVICDDCFQKINPAKFPKLVEEVKRII